MLPLVAPITLLFREENSVMSGNSVWPRVLKFLRLGKYFLERNSNGAIQQQTVVLLSAAARGTRW